MTKNAPLFDAMRVIKNALSLQKTKPDDPLLDHAAQILCERLTWHQAYSSNDPILILGPYGYILERKLKTLMPQKTFWVHYRDVVFLTEEMPFPESYFSCILSFFDLQTVNDLFISLQNIHYSLKKQGCFLGVFVGGESFLTAAQKLFALDSQSQRGVPLRFHPTFDLQTATHALKQAGFNVPVGDRESHERSFSSFYQLVNWLRFLKATRCLRGPLYTLPRAVEYNNPISVNVDCIYLIGLKS